MLPLLMFLIFAVFWGAYDVVQGLYVALIPSARTMAMAIKSFIVSIPREVES